MSWEFFIRRPIFGTVLSLVVVMAGLMAFRLLPVSQYPQIAPPTATGELEKVPPTRPRQRTSPVAAVTHVTTPRSPHR